MSETGLNRVRDDLATIKQAAGLELPFGKEDVRLGLWSAIIGVFVTACAVFSPWEYRRMIFVPIGLAVLLTVWTSIKMRQQRTKQPGRWREQRTIGIAVLVFLPLAIGYKYWERASGRPGEMVGAASVVFFGVGVLVAAVIEKKRLYYAGGAIPLMAVGISIPLCTPRQVMIAAGLCWITGGLAVAAIQAWQLRTNGTEHAAD